MNKESKNYIEELRYELQHRNITMEKIANEAKVSMYKLAELLDAKIDTSSFTKVQLDKMMDEVKKAQLKKDDASPKVAAMEGRTVKIYEEKNLLPEEELFHFQTPDKK